MTDTETMTTSDSTVEGGSGNVFADLGLPEADAHLLEADLVSRIDAIVRHHGITRTEAARRPGLSVADRPNGATRVRANGATLGRQMEHAEVRAAIGSRRAARRRRDRNGAARREGTS